MEHSEEKITAPDNNLLAILTDLRASACELRRLVSEARQKQGWLKALGKRLTRFRTPHGKQVGPVSL
jgi:hypothetical protein